MSSRAPVVVVTRNDLLDRYHAVRRMTNVLCEPLSPEDMIVQVAPEASPTKWHLAHTTWFFETFILEGFEPDFRPYDPAFRILFNSYYVTVGERHPRPRRGLLTRPGIGEVMAYRDTVDERIARVAASASEEEWGRIAELLELGIHHEQQHQELLLTDLMLLLHANPVQPAAYPDSDGGDAVTDRIGAPRWIEIPGGVVAIGHDPDAPEADFAYDNESPRHRRFLEAFEMADRLVTNREFAEFIEDGGYRTSTLWLDEAWMTVQQGGWTCPIYWCDEGGGTWSEFTLRGRREVDPDAPARHLSFWEAEAFARWAGARLPTEAEWEHATAPVWDAAVETGTFLDPERLGPARAGVIPGAEPWCQVAGELWQWTRSGHEPYPGYAPPSGAVGEYNGKFMSGTYVLRGGSCVTPRDHVRATYRNFFFPEARWQFAGIRLARGGEPDRDAVRDLG